MEGIKLYRREVRPMLYGLPTQGFTPKPYPLFNEDSWYPEDMEEKIREWTEPSLKAKYHGWTKLIFDERFVLNERSEK